MAPRRGVRRGGEYESGPEGAHGGSVWGSMGRAVEALA